MSNYNAITSSGTFGFVEIFYLLFFFFSSRRRHTRSLCDWSSDVCSSDLPGAFYALARGAPTQAQRAADGQVHAHAFEVRCQGDTIQVEPGDVTTADHCQMMPSSFDEAGED